MAPYQMIAALIFRLFLPVLLAICTGMRFSFMSLAYLILLMINPFLPAPNAFTMQGHTGIYLKVTAVLGIFNFVLQFIFQIVLLSIPPYGHTLPFCGTDEVILRHFGLVRLDAILEIDGTRWILPECLMLVFGPVTYIACLKLSERALSVSHACTLPSESASAAYKNMGLRVLNAVGTYATLTLIGLAAILMPSLISAVYFAVFLASATYWGLNNTLGRRFGYVCRGLMGLAGVHVFLLYIYQAEWLQRYIPPEHVAIRVFGFTALTFNDCNQLLKLQSSMAWHTPSEFLLPNINDTSDKFSDYLLAIDNNTNSSESYLDFSSAIALGFHSTNGTSPERIDPRTAESRSDEWTRFFNPVVLLLLYYVLYFESGFLISNQAALLTQTAAMPSSVHNFLRRSTVRKRSVKSQRSNAPSTRSGEGHKERYPSLTIPNAIKGSAHSLNYCRKGSALSARSAPLPKTPEFLSASRKSYRRPSAISEMSGASPLRRTIHRQGHYRSASVYRATPLFPTGILKMSDSRMPLSDTHLNKENLDGSHTSSPRPNQAPSSTVAAQPQCQLSGPQPSGSYQSMKGYEALSSDSEGDAEADVEAQKSATPDLNGSIPGPRDSTSVQGEAKPDKRNSFLSPGGGFSLFMGRGRGSSSAGGRGEDEAESEDEHPLQMIIAPLITVFKLVIRSSYIATNIVMMAWSITYHSWLTFVLLLWACVLWMIPNQRAAMLRCSPFLVIYADLLLIIQYIYCMDLTDEELPSEMETVNLGQIGLVKYRYLPYKPLLVKILYTCMFWVTLRQYIKEVIGPTTTGLSMAAALQPFTVAVTTASPPPQASLISNSEHGEESIMSPEMQRFGNWLRNLLVKFWIWLVATMLFIFAIQGSEIVIFRVMYMVLFLIFTITFQVSYAAWRKFLYGFWLTVIIYQMFVLVLTYTHQFDNFPQYWENYTKIDIELQQDIGLEVYDTGRLFVKLMTPTFFVIVTIIQVHYFHHDFLKLSDIEKIPEKKEEKKPVKKGAVPKMPNLMNSCLLEDVTNAAHFIAYNLSGYLQQVITTVVELSWRFLELHIMKIVLGSVMLLACYDLYEDPTIVPNSAPWIGFSKSSNLPKYLKGYIGIILVITVQAVVGIRQEYRRMVTGLLPHPEGVLFPNITRSVADDGLPECIKFLLNYGFYKFGLEYGSVLRSAEHLDDKACKSAPVCTTSYINNHDSGSVDAPKKMICLISLVGVIGTRLDAYSLFYSGWLCYLYRRRRKEIAAIWKWFIISIAAVIPIQYLMCVGIPPGLCIEYPWDGVMNKELREWLFFPDFDKPPESYKIRRVFEIEFCDGAENYEGGSNVEIIYEPPENHDNPIPDFVTYTRTYLDLAKMAVFFTSYWVTLAVMFLTGTNRVTLFALGYVLGSFIFLWQGNEFYLRPLSTILRLWNHLLGYNVAVIFIKTFLQLLGCVFLSELAWGACWFVQLLGIACVKKFGDKSDDALVAELADICTVPKSEAGLMWDGICFGFLLLQRRLFSSYYFRHLVTEIRAQTQLASRGAELISELMQKEIAQQRAAEQEVIRKIREKMEKIKASQKKEDDISGKEPQDHYEANTSEQFSNASSPLPLELGTPTHPSSMIGDSRLSPGNALLSIGAGNAPSPSSANMTLSLDGFLEPTRMSLTTPYQTQPQDAMSSSDDSFPVFSPPPYQRGPPPFPKSHYDIGPPWLKEYLSHHRRPSVSSVSHHASTCSAASLYRRREVVPEMRGSFSLPRNFFSSLRDTFLLDRNVFRSHAIRSGDYHMFEELDDDPILPIDYDAPSVHEEPIQGMTVSELLSSAMKSGIEQATEEARLARLSEIESMSRRSSFAKLPPLKRTLSGRSQFSQISRASRTTSRSVRIHAKPKSPPKVPHSPPAVPASPPSRSPRVHTSTEEPPPPPLPSGDGDKPSGEPYVEDDKDKVEPKGLAPIIRKIVHYVRFGQTFVESVILTATKLLNQFSKDYRYVSFCLSEEKIRLKESEEFIAQNQVGLALITDVSTWTDFILPQNGQQETAALDQGSVPMHSSSTDTTALIKQKIRKKPKKAKKDKLKSIQKFKKRGLMKAREPFEIRVEKASEDKTDGSGEGLDLPQDDDAKTKARPLIMQFGIACWYAVLSRSELVSYIMIFVNQIKSASILSLPLPFMVFLWGSLSVPRPPKTFWITVIAYTEVIVIVKYLFQFDFFPWNTEERLNAPFWAPRILGIEKKNRYALYDLALLLVVFFHRFMLKSLGLWKESSSSSVASTSSGAGNVSDDESSSSEEITKSHTMSSQHSVSKIQEEPSSSDSSIDSEEVSLSSHEKDSSLISYTKDSSLISSTRDASSLSNSKDTLFTGTRHVGSSQISKDISLTLQGKDLMQRPLEYSSGTTFDESVESSFSIPRQEFYSDDPEQHLLDLPRPSIYGALPRTDYRHSRQSSLVSQSGTSGQQVSRHSSLILHPHRRQLSEGSKVSFQDPTIGGMARSSFASSQFPSKKSSVSAKSCSAASNSAQIPCIKVNFKAFKDFKKPDVQEVKENIKKLPKVAKKRAKRGFELVKKFLMNVLKPDYQVAVNMYTFMFLCDFFNFFVLIFGFSAFGTQQGDGGVSAYLEENRVPIPFLVMLILQFGLIIIDRALFLRKFILGKLIYQVVLTFGIHIWMFFILPAITEREFNAKRPPQIWYMVKCLYLLLSAYQIRCGYPTRILGNFFCKQYNYINNLSFRVFMNVPFLYELRTLMDWIWTDTSMNLSDWIKMEDIFVRIFQLKCERKSESEYPQGRGEGKKKLMKYVMGGCALFGVIALIWFPLVLFALSSTVGLPNLPYDVTLEITIGSYQPVFKMKALQPDLYRFTQRDWDNLNYLYRSDRTGQTFLSNYDYPDVAVAKLSGNSTANWGISPPAQERMISELLSNYTIKVKIVWIVKRVSNTADVAPESKQEREILLKPYEGNKRNPVREDLAELLQGNLSKNPVTIPKLMPKFIKVTNKGAASYVTQLYPEDKGFVDLEFTLVTGDIPYLSARQEWWEVQENCDKSSFNKYPLGNLCDYLLMYTFNDKAFPKGLSFISGGGIVGMYTTLVMVASRLLRGHFADVSATIMFDDMPNVDRILQLCLDIYLVRESGDLSLEEDLFAKLIFLFRSPETLIKWTRPLEEEEEELSEDEHGNEN